MAHISPSFVGATDGKAYKVGVVDKQDYGVQPLYRTLRRYGFTDGRSTDGRSTNKKRLVKHLANYFPSLMEKGWPVKDSFHMDHSLQLLFEKSLV